MELKPLKLPDQNMNVDDEDLARTIAADSGWLVSPTGKIYDAQKVSVADDLTALGRMMRAKNWFTPKDTYATGVNWRNVPDVDERASRLRA